MYSEAIKNGKHTVLREHDMTKTLLQEVRILTSCAKRGKYLLLCDNSNIIFNNLEEFGGRLYGMKLSQTLENLLKK